MHTYLGKGRFFSQHQHLFPFAQRLCGHGKHLETPDGDEKENILLEQRQREEVSGFD